jgi:ATP phosphoribosyltransferase regulatory subunit
VSTAQPPDPQTEPPDAASQPAPDASQPPDAPIRTSDQQSRIPSGTRDVLPDEMRELRAMTDRVRAVFERAGYGEVYTPALEYETTFARRETPSAQPAYRMFDEQGNVLVLRSDMTIPIARLVATRYANAEPPFRFCYFAHAYRGVRPSRGQSREFLQAGAELIGAPGPHGTAEALTLLAAALDAAGLQTYRIGVGDASLYPALLDAVGVPQDKHDGILTELVNGSFVGLEHDIRRLSLDPHNAELLLRVPQIRGGPEVLEHLETALHDAVTGLRAVHGLLEPRVAERIIFDLGLVRSLGYYTGAVFQVYDPAYGVPIGSGGRYDELLGRFGRSLPAVGFALNVERMHIALTGEERRPQ